jgi:hypothetical protein
MGHTPGRMEVRTEERNPSFPFTLDLRRDILRHPQREGDE